MRFNIPLFAAAVALCMALLPLEYPCGAAQNDAAVQLTIVGCNATSQTSTWATITLRALTSSGRIISKTLPISQSSHYVKAEIDVPPGAYIFTATGPQCYGAEVTAILSGLERHLAILASADIHSPQVATALAGHFPEVGVLKVTFSPNDTPSSEISAQIDGGAYYVSHMPSSGGKLNIYFYGSDTAVHVAIPSTSRAKDHLLQRDVSFAELTRRP